MTADGTINNPTNDAGPIFVTGMPRSGTTFFQHLLSQHPRIEIHGQEPVACAWGGWLNLLMDGDAKAADSNERLNYESDHYAAPDDPSAVASRFLPFMKWYLTGGKSTPRWGVKSLTECRAASEAVIDHWPDTRWLVCIRNPFRSVESLRNTYDRNQQIELETAVQWWTDAVAFAHTHPAAMPILFDRLCEADERTECVREVFSFIGEDYVTEVQHFVDEWPFVHKVVPEDKRTYELSAAERTEMLTVNSTFQSWVERLGYLDQEAAAI